MNYLKTPSKTIIKQTIIVLGLVMILLLPCLVFAESPMDKLDNVAQDGGYSPADNTTMAAVAGRAVFIFLGLLGIIFIILMIYAGYLWMTAAGDESKVESAKNTIRRAIIGLLIVVGAYAIWIFINLLLISS